MGGRKYAARRHDATLYGHSHLTGRLAKFLSCFVGQVAQLVEQRTENPRVGSSILPLAIRRTLDGQPSRKTEVSHGQCGRARRRGSAWGSEWVRPGAYG